jgi:hypothetical protein
MDQQQPQTPASTRPLLYFVLWQRASADERAQQLASWGYDVRYDYSYNEDELQKTMERVLAIQPDAIVMSLDAFPGYTRSFALGLKARSGLHRLPRLIVGGEEAQVEQTKRRCPDAVYSDWDGLAAALTTTLGQEPPPADKAPLPEARAFLQG